MNRAYSLLAVKAVEDDRRVIRGIATTPTPDRVGDIVDPLGVSFKNPLPLLWQHNHDKPVGRVKFDAPTKEGITFEAELPTVDEAGALRDRVEEAWQSVKHGLVTAVSIGFRPVKHAYLDGGGIHFLNSEVFELSLVTIPAQPEAVIAGLKSMGHDGIALLKRFDTGAPLSEAAPDLKNSMVETPAASGKSVRVVRLNDTARDGAKPFVIRTIKR